MNLWKASGGCVVGAICTMLSVDVHAQSPNLQAAADQIVKSDAAFAQSVADKNREKFLTFIAEMTTFNGGTPNELRGRDAVMKGWEDFFAPDGPTLTWAPIKGEVFGAGDFGYTTGRSVFSAHVPGLIPPAFSRSAFSWSDLLYRLEPASTWA
jgi:ketosteroid isomerase-like protein